MCIEEEDRRGKDNFVSFFLFFLSNHVTILLLSIIYMYMCVCIYFFLPFFSFCKLPVDYFHVDREDFQTVC